MTRPNLKFKADHFDPDIIAATNELFDAKPWRLDVGVIDLYQKWADSVTAISDVPSVKIVDVGADTPGYQYTYDYESDGGNVILLGRPSLATVFCGVGHHIHAHGPISSFFTPYPAEHGVYWGFSLFYVCRPVMFRRRVREGRIIGMTAKDTFTNDTWAQLVSLGLTNGNFLIDPQFDIRTLEGEDDLVNPSDFEEAEDSAELAPVIDLRDHAVNPCATLFDDLDQYSVTQLRRASRGVFSGGYNMPKQALVTALVSRGVTSADVEAANHQ